MDRLEETQQRCAVNLCTGEDADYLLSEVDRLGSEVGKWMCLQAEAEKARRHLKSENLSLAARAEAAEAALDEVYERTRPGGEKGGYPYGGTTCIGADVYNIVAKWRDQQTGKGGAE